MRDWRSFQHYPRYSGGPRPGGEPVAPAMAVSLPRISLTEEEHEERAHNVRTARAMIELDRALAEQKAEEAKQRRASLDGTAIGALMR